jgi:hypothetical protein
MRLQAESKLGQLTARNLANSIWAFAKLGHHPGTLLGRLCREVRGCHRRSTSWWLQPRTSCVARTWVGAWTHLYARADEDDQQLAPPCTATASYPVDRQWHSAAPTLEGHGLGWPGLLAQVANKLGEFNAQNLSNTLWALSTLGGRRAGLDLLLTSTPAALVLPLPPQFH